MKLNDAAETKGVPVFIDWMDNYQVEKVDNGDHTCNGLALTFDELAERDRKIWDAARETIECSYREWEAMKRICKYYGFEQWESSQAEGGSNGN